jgi:20S proteasome alpha/beta subunit
MYNLADMNESSDISVKESGMQDKKVKAVAKNVDTNKVIEYFKESIDSANSYTLDEYKKLITAAFKEAAKKTKRSVGASGEVVKREPTKYNIFVKEEILKLKAENPDKQYKDLMKMAADKWNENKLTV